MSDRIGTEAFSGAKLALFVGAELVVIDRDDRADIPYPGFLDLPGGGREGAESPEACVLRETHEEIGLRLDPAGLVWARRYARPRGPVWFFVTHLPTGADAGIRFGGEGQGWRLMPPSVYLVHPLAIPHHAAQLRAYLSERDDAGGSV